MNFKKLKPLEITLAILGVIVVGLIIALIDQQMTGARLTSDIAREKDSLARLSKASSDYQTMSNNYFALSSKVGRHEDRAVSGQVPFIINQLTGIMQSHKLRMETLSPEPATAGNGVSRQPMRITFKGSLGDVTRTIQDIENTVPFLYIERFDMHAGEEKSDTLQCDMTVSSFSIQGSKMPGTKDKKAPVTMPDNSHKVVGAAASTAKNATVVAGADGGKP
jgi:Tfp pilus assembly protein PilO